MKVFVGLLIVATLCISARAQDAKVIAEISASSEKIVRNSPFSADAVSESVQTLVDGNRIVRSSTSKLYRNSEGRFRRDTAGGSGSLFGSVYSLGQGTTILDPVAGHRYLLNPDLKTARLALLKPLAALTLRAGSTTIAEQKEKIVEKLRSEIKVASPDGVVSSHLAQTITGVLSSGVQGGVIAYSSLEHSKYETRTEELGMQNIEGVEAEGKRTTTTIPAGAIGNERPIEVVYERWYSNDLQLVVMSKHSDPRFGEQTYRLTNILRSEPDPSLFSLPIGYRLITEPSAAYRLSTAKAELEKTTLKAAQSGITVVKTKP